MIKIASPDEDVIRITDEDVNIASIKLLVANLTAQSSVLACRADELATQAHVAVTQQNRTAALAALRSKKLVTEVLNRRLVTLVQLESVYQKIEEAADQLEVVKAMQVSTEVLKSFNTQIGGVEGVDAVLDGLHEEMMKVDEVREAIAGVGQATESVDEEEIDQELEDMEKRARQEVEQLSSEAIKAQLKTLPNVRADLGPGTSTERFANSAPEVSEGVGSGVYSPLATF